MERRQVIEVLNCVLRTLGRSLPMYVQEGRRLWTTPSAEPLQRVLAEIAADHRYYVARLGQLICKWDGCVEGGQFPLAFTALNDVSLAWLWREVMELHQRDIAALEHCQKRLSDAPEAQSLIEEILGNARGHLETLQELTAGAGPTVG